MTTPTLSDLRRLFYGATPEQSNADAEYQFLLRMQERNLSFSDLVLEPFVSAPEGWVDDLTSRNAQAVGRLVRYGILSDSTGAGIFTDNFDNGWVGQLRTAAQLRLGNGGSGWLDAVNSVVGAFGGPGGYQGADTIVSSSPAWTSITNGVNSNAQRPAAPGNNATIQFFPVGSSLDLVSRVDPTFTQYSRNLDGGGDVVVPQNLAAAVQINTLNPGGTNHSLVITASGGECRYHGVRGRNSTGVIVDNFSKGGRSIVTTGGSNDPLSEAAEGLAGQTSLSTTFSVMKPLDLLIISLGVNDAVSGGVGTYDQLWEELTLIHREIRNAGVDANTPPLVLVIIQHVGTFVDAASPYRWNRQVSILREWATSIGACIFDTWTAGKNSGEYASNVLNWFGFGAGDVHPSAAYNTFIATTLINLFGLN